MTHISRIYLSLFLTQLLMDIYRPTSSLTQIQKLTTNQYWQKFILSSKDILKTICSCKNCKFNCKLFYDLIILYARKCRRSITRITKPNLIQKKCCSSYSLCIIKLPSMFCYQLSFKKLTQKCEPQVGSKLQILDQSRQFEGGYFGGSLNQ